MNFNNFGIQPQAMAVMAYLGNYDGIEPSWKDGRYHARVEAAPWYNGRERGIVFYMSNPSGKQLNIAVYEHRNTDSICALMWEQNTYINPPTLQELPEGVFESKWDYSQSWNYGDPSATANWIYEQFCDHWNKDNIRATGVWCESCNDLVDRCVHMGD